MQISYDGLWEFLVSKQLNKTDLIKMTNIGSATLAKLGKNQAVSLLVLMKICNALDCQLSDICKFTRGTGK